MNITYLILAHNNPNFLYSLIERLEYPNVDFLIHIDKKSTDNFNKLKLLPNVHFAQRQSSLEWGGISIVETLISCCNEIKEQCKGEVICLLSGSDYPVKSNDYIYNYLHQNRTKNFIIGMPLPSLECNWTRNGNLRLRGYALRLKSRSIASIEPRVFNLTNLKQFIKVALVSPKKLFEAINIWIKYPIRKHPLHIKPYGGEFWWILPYSTIIKICQYIEKHPDFIAYHKDTLIPDEIVFNTLVYNLCDKSEIKNTCLRYINWQKGKLSSPTDINKEDIEIIKYCIKQPNILFARKINESSSKLIDKLLK